jgi:basic membrane lipoprotein Med (substrate-binding protein (PBP1-ABC) superfamily)
MKFNTRLFAFVLTAVIAVAVIGLGSNLPVRAQAALKIALISPSAKNDLAWSQSMADALLAVQKEMGEDKLELTFSENLFRVPDAAAAIRDYASQGYDIVIAHGTQYGASMFEVAGDFPDVSFAWGTATDYGKEQGLTNVFAYEARAEEGGYVNGVMAAMLSKSGVLGVVGPVNAGDAKLYIDGFEAGAKATKDSIDVKKIFTDSFGDIPKATEAAKTLIGQGADVLTGSAQQVPGAISEIQKVKGYWFGTQTDQAAGWPDTVVAVQVFDWTAVIKDMIAMRQAGTKGGKAYEISLKDGGLKIQFNEKVTVPDDVKKAADEAVAAISDGKIVVPGSPKAMMEATAEPTPAQ